MKAQKRNLYPQKYNRKQSKINKNGKKFWKNKTRKVFDTTKLLVPNQRSKTAQLVHFGYNIKRNNYSEINEKCCSTLKELIRRIP